MELRGVRSIINNKAKGLLELSRTPCFMGCRDFDTLDDQSRSLGLMYKQDMLFTRCRTARSLNYSHIEIHTRQHPRTKEAP
jgi:hypothetical protein